MYIYIYMWTPHHVSILLGVCQHCCLIQVSAVEIATIFQAFPLGQMSPFLLEIWSTTIDQWEFQDPKLEVLYHIRPYFLGISPYIGLT